MGTVDGYIYRPMRPTSRRIARWLRNSPISPDVFTLCWFFSYLAAAACFATGERILSLAASGFILLAGLLDCLDGDLARARKSSSVAGAVLEQVLHWISQAALIIGIVLGYGEVLLPGCNPGLVVGVALLVDQMFHQLFFIINSAMDPTRNYGVLHRITAAILPFMPINSNAFLITGVFGVPQLGLAAYTMFATVVFLMVAALYYFSEKFHDQNGLG